MAAIASLVGGLNLSSTLASTFAGQQLGASDLTLLRMSICDSALVPTDSAGVASGAFSSAAATAAAAATTIISSRNNEQQAPPAAEAAQLLVGALSNQLGGGSGGADALKPLSKLALDYLIGPVQEFDSKLDYYFSEIWTKTGDERTSRLPLMTGGPWKLIYATLVYLYLIKWLLPKVMRPFKPLELNWLIRGYNLLMVLGNLYAFYHGVRVLSWGSRCFGCQVIKHLDYSPEAIELLHYGWLFFLSRLVEWLDTIFFVLRKKERQVTKLHVFHHSFVPLITWTYLKYHPGYTMAFFPFVNTFVHTIMYGYYFLATFGPAVQPYLWWKKHLTSLQIAQFVLILIQLASIPMSANERCQYPRGFLYVAFAGAILFLWLFYTYYVDTYSTTKTSAAAGRKRASSATNNNNGRQSTTREGSSRSLSDAIENAIDSSPMDPQPQSSGLNRGNQRNQQQQQQHSEAATTIDNLRQSNDGKKFK